MNSTLQEKRHQVRTQSLLHFSKLHLTPQAKLSSPPKQVILSGGKTAPKEQSGRHSFCFEKKLKRTFGTSFDLFAPSDTTKSNLKVLPFVALRELRERERSLQQGPHEGCSRFCNSIAESKTNTNYLKHQTKKAHKKPTPRKT